jgi:hypothetical protein
MSLLFYFDKFTAWLDFSWLITRPNKVPINKVPINKVPTYSAVATDLPPIYVCEIGECKPEEIKPTVGEEKPVETK